jgi:hypothetical protein
VCDLSRIAWQQQGVYYLFDAMCYLNLQKKKWVCDLSSIAGQQQGVYYLFDAMCYLNLQKKIECSVYFLLNISCLFLFLNKQLMFFNNLGSTKSANSSST